MTVTIIFQLMKSCPWLFDGWSRHRRSIFTLPSCWFHCLWPKAKDVGITCIVVGQWPKALMSFDSYNWLKPFNRMVEEPQFMNQDEKGQNLFNHSSKIAARITARLIAKNYIKMFHEHQLAQLILTSRYASTFRYFCPNPNKNYCKLSWKAIGLIRSNLINICHLHYF